jgi:hypothetical protein
VLVRSVRGGARLRRFRLISCPGQRTLRRWRTAVSAPGHVGDIQALVPVWFDRYTDAEDLRRVGVYIGATRVGALDRTSTESFGAVMKAAEERGGKPRSMSPLARAKHLKPPYLLVVDMPGGIPSEPSTGRRQNAL